MAGVETKIRTPCQCPSCDLSLQDDTTAIQHFRTKEHAQKMTENLERLGKTLPESILAELRTTILYVAKTSEPEPIEVDAFECLRRANAAPATPSGPTSGTAQADTTKPHSTPQRYSNAEPCRARTHPKEESGRGRVDPGSRTEADGHGERIQGASGAHGAGGASAQKGDVQADRRRGEGKTPCE